jgi:phosphoribosylaminoimidazole-succinocarboxamide synthase
MVRYVDRVEHGTSVKTIDIIRRPTPTHFGVSDFSYRPVFSVFDYGTIEPPVPLDNSTVCLMQAFNFELLARQDLDNHSLGLVTPNGELISAREAIRRRVAPTITRVQFVNRIMPTHHGGRWDYSMFRSPADNNHVHPIEFISRNELPESSSVWGRIERGELELVDLGLPADFRTGDPVPDHLKPILDYSTKFEPEDRYLSPEQARDILGIDQRRFDEINDMTRHASKVMTDYAASRGFARLDGKVEYITFVEEEQFDVLGDAVCTWHEDRLLTPQGVEISKQRIRDKVKQVNPRWYAEVERAKQQARDEGRPNFRMLMDSSIEYTSPEPEFFDAINNLFRAGTNQWVDARVYDVYLDQDNSMGDDLERAVEEFQEVA